LPKILAVTANTMTVESQLIKEVFKRDAMYQLAEVLDISLESARNYLYKKFPGRRRQQLALALLMAMDKQDARREELRSRLRALLHGEMDEAGARILINGNAERIAPSNAYQDLGVVARRLAKEAAE
jgi:hypothetical protein